MAVQHRAKATALLTVQRTGAQKPAARERAILLRRQGLAEKRKSGRAVRTGCTTIPTVSTAVSSTYGVTNAVRVSWPGVASTLLIVPTGTPGTLVEASAVPSVSTGWISVTRKR